MKYVFLTLLIYSSMILKAESLKKISPTEIYKNIYSHGKTFYFKYTILIDNVEFRIVPEEHKVGLYVVRRSEYEKYIYPASKDTLFIDTLEFYIRGELVKNSGLRKKYKPTIWFGSKNFHRTFGKINYTVSTDYLKIFPMTEDTYESGFMNNLQVCPSPMISITPDIIKTWTDSNVISNSYSNDKWRTWNDSLKIVSDYQIIGNENIVTTLGNLQTWRIEAESNSEIGSTELIAHFSIEYGFVLLEFKFVDGTLFKMELIQVV